MHLDPDFKAFVESFIVHDVDSDRARERTMPVGVDNLVVNAIGRHDLIHNKLAAGGPQDLACRTVATRVRWNLVRSSEW